MLKYQTPARPQTPDYIAALRWWHSLPTREKISLRRDEGLRSCIKIVGYWEQHYKRVTFFNTGNEN